MFIRNQRRSEDQMKKGAITPALMATLFAAACGEGGDPTTVEPVDSRAGVRFFSAMRAMPGPGGFTMNGQFVSGSAIGTNQATGTCAKVSEGPTSFGFGLANAGGTGLSGGTLATLNNQSIAAGGNYTVVVPGSGMHALLFLLDNKFSGSLGNNQAAVRFVNLAPSATPFTVLSGTGSGSTTTVASNLALGAPTAFTTVTSGSNAYTVLNGQNTAISGSAGTLSLQAGSVNTIAIVPGTAQGSLELINIPRC
jgi:hypothetical protein